MRKRRRYRMDWGGYLKEMQDPNDLLIQNQMSKQAKADAFNNSFGMKLLDTAGQAALNTGLSIATSAAGSALKGVMAKKVAVGADKVGELQKANDALEAKGDKMTMEDQVAFDKNNKSIKKWNRKINNYKVFGDVSGDLMRGLGGLASSGISMAINSFDTGGEVQDGYIPIEAEGGELIQTPYDDEAQYIEGPDHEQGGVDLDVPSGSVVYSKRVKDGNGVSMAERKVKRDRLVKKWQKKVKDNPTNELHKQTLAKVQRNAQIEEANDVQFMEMHRQAKDYSNYFKKATMNYGKGNGKYLAASRGKYASGGMTGNYLHYDANGRTYSSPYREYPQSSQHDDWIREPQRHAPTYDSHTTYNPDYYDPERDDNNLIARENQRRRNLRNIRLDNIHTHGGFHNSVPSNNYGDFYTDKRDNTYVYSPRRGHEGSIAESARDVLSRLHSVKGEEEHKPVKVTRKHSKAIKTAVNKAVKKHINVVKKQAKQATNDLKKRTEEFLKRTAHLDSKGSVHNKKQLSSAELNKKVNIFLGRNKELDEELEWLNKESEKALSKQQAKLQALSYANDKKISKLVRKGNEIKGRMLSHDADKISHIVMKDGSVRKFGNHSNEGDYKRIEAGREGLYNDDIRGNDELMARTEQSLLGYNPYYDNGQSYSYDNDPRYAPENYGVNRETWGGWRSPDGTPLEAVQVPETQGNGWDYRGYDPGSGSVIDHNGNYVGPNEDEYERFMNEGGYSRFNNRSSWYKGDPANS